jgi:hypothetical protein
MPFAIEGLPVLDLAPRGAHAKASRARGLGPGRRLQDLVHLHHRLAGDGLVMRRLRAIGAVFGTAARLDAEKGAELHFVLLVVLGVHRARAVDEFEQRKVVKGTGFANGPVVAESRHGLGML